MDNNQKVTVITVSYNLIENDREETFNDCLKSVHSQTHKNIEHIVIDGASTDGTIDLIKKYADKGWITYLSEPDRGVYDAMTKGVNLAKGEYIYFLNTDDKFFDDLVVEDVLKVFKKSFLKIS
jgi:glycosyltransferase involved in cell wall biosynthesis